LIGHGSGRNGGNNQHVTGADEGTSFNRQEVSPSSLKAVNEVSVPGCGVQAPLALNELLPNVATAADLAVDVVGVATGVASLKAKGFDAATM
jgi:hypothetical protein